MWRNCLLRSGLEEPSWVLRFPCKLYFCARSSFPTVVEPTMCPFSQSSLARVRVLLHVQRIPRIGSPRTVGSIRASRSERSVGSFFVTHFRPPPGFRTRPPARGCSSKCCLPRVIRGREIPVARCTMVTPPWPMDRASAAHHSRSVRSSRCGAMSAYRFSSAAIGEPMVGSVTFIHVQVLRSGALMREFFLFNEMCPLSDFCLEDRAVTLYMRVGAHSGDPLVRAEEVDGWPGVHREEDGDVLAFPERSYFTDDAVGFVVQILERGRARLHDAVHVEAILLGDALELFEVPADYCIDAVALAVLPNRRDARRVMRARMGGRVAFRRADFLLFHVRHDDDVVERPVPRSARLDRDVPVPDAAAGGSRSEARDDTRLRVRERDLVRDETGNRPRECAEDRRGGCEADARGDLRTDLDCEGSGDRIRGTQCREVPFREFDGFPVARDVFLLQLFAGSVCEE